METIRLFIGYDRMEPVAFHVLSHSIMRRASVPVSITPLALNNLHGVFKRERVANQATDFSFSRFLVPYLCGFSGWAAFMDCDMLMLGDFAELWAQRDDRRAVMCVKHDHRPTETRKFLGNVQTQYPMKNWSSVMLMNTAKCWRLQPDYVNTATGLELHRFTWLGGADWDPSIEDQIGALPHEWNHLVGYDDVRCEFPRCECDLTNNDRHACQQVLPYKIKNLHFTEGGPWFDAYKDAPFADLWRAERDAAFGASTNY